MIESITQQNGTSRQIILHMGFHKTATTSIQRTLGINNARLLEKGYLYPDFKLNNEVYYNHSIPLYGLFSPIPQNYHIYIKMNWRADELNPRFQRLLDQYLASEHHLILSGEDISSLDEPSLARLKLALSTKNTKFRAIVFVRDPFTAYISRVQELLKSGQHSLAQITRQYHNPQLQLVNKLKLIFPDIEFYTFENAIAFPGGPAAFFLSLLQLSSANYEMIKCNESISMPAAQLLSYINQQAPLIINKRINFTRKAQDHRAIFKVAGEKFTLLKQQIAPHYEQIMRDKQLLENATNVKFPKEETAIDNLAGAWQWDQQSITSLLCQLPELADGILYRIYDYFFHLFRQRQLTEPSFFLIGESIEKELNSRECHLEQS